MEDRTEQTLLCGRSSGQNNKKIGFTNIISRLTAFLLSVMLIAGIFIISNTSAVPDTVAAFAFSADTGNDAYTVINDSLSPKNSGSSGTDTESLRGKKLLLGGMPFGIKLYTDGILISGTSEVDTEEGNQNPGHISGLKPGDIIKKINGKEATAISDVLDAAYASEGKPLLLTIARGEKIFETEIKPLFSKSEKAYKLGLWIRDGTAGIGTVTYIDPETNYFGGLGHGVCDADTGLILPMSSGKLNEVTINGIEKGEKGDPGELQGYFSSDEIGVLISNTDYGIFGVYNKIEADTSKEISVALADEVKEGPATILCTLSSNNICEYEIEIEEICKNSSSTKNFVINVTDKDLINETGGIVQGMSGSPVIQNGKLVGAVTHVLVEDPLRGYGIFIENMLTESE